MTHILEVKYHATSQQFVFPDKASAEAVMVNLRPMLGEKYYGKNEDEKKTFKFLHSYGEAVVVCEKIEAVLITDADAARADLSKHQDIMDQDYIRRRKIVRAALGEDDSVTE